MDFHEVRSSACGHSNHTPLIYYYDDDWGHKGSEVWYKGSDGKIHEGKLNVCLSCGMVFVKGNDNDIK